MTNPTATTPAALERIVERLSAAGRGMPVPDPNERAILCADARAVIAALQGENTQLQSVNADMTARMDRISGGALYADLTTRAELAEAKLRDIAEAWRELDRTCVFTDGEDFSRLRRAIETATIARTAGEKDNG